MLHLVVDAQLQFAYVGEDAPTNLSLADFGKFQIITRRELL